MEFSGELTEPWEQDAQIPYDSGNCHTFAYLGILGIAGDSHYPLSLPPGHRDGYRTGDWLAQAQCLVASALGTGNTCPLCARFGRS